MNKKDVLFLYDYNYWANAKILNAAAKVDNDKFTAAAKLSHGGLRGTLHHAYIAEYLWRMRLSERVSPTSISAETEYPDLATLRAAWDDEEKKMREFINNLTDEKLGELIPYTTMKGYKWEDVLWQALAHVANHGTQHRAEAAVLLTDFGASPGDVDMLIYYREQKK
jgi:uncharacterized damage-inducible protein DinB